MADAVREFLIIVEDDEGVARLEARSLERAGYEVSVFGTLREALAEPRIEAADCWIIDQGLPGGDTGLLLVSELRIRGILAPVVLVTGSEDPQILMSALRAGVNDYVQKGTGFIELLENRVRMVLSSSKAESELRLSRIRNEVHAERQRELELEIAERKQAEARAQKALKRLQELDRRKNEFLAMLGHELRNPLAPIATAVEVLALQREDPKKVRWAADLIGRQLEQVRRLVDDILDVARIMNDQLELRLDSVDVGELLDRSIESIEPLLQSKAHQLIYNRPTAPCVLRGDRVRLIQVFSNLLENAAKYTPPHGTIQITATCDETSHARIEIRDNGVGISEGEIEELFGLFAQGERQLDRAEGGLGLGLALVRRIVELHGGSADAESDGVGKGSCFRVQLPMSPNVPPPQTSKRTSKALPPAKVLVVDDNVDAANSLSFLLSMWGLTVSVAHDGETGLELIRKNDPDLVLLDIGLPGKDGTEVRAAAREFDTRSDRRWIAITGYGQASDRERTANAGFDKHLVKPVTGGELRQVLEFFLADDKQAPDCEPS